MQFVMGIAAVLTGVGVVLLRRRFAVRGERVLRRRYGALGDENAKHITPRLYALGGIAMIALGIYWIVISVWFQGN